MASSVIPKINKQGLLDIPLLYTQEGINKFIGDVVAMKGSSACGIAEVYAGDPDHPNIFDFTGRVGLLIVRHSTYSNWGHLTFTYLSDTYMWSGRIQHDPNTKAATVEYYKYYKGTTPS